MLAAQKGNATIARILLRYCANVEVMIINQETALIIAA